MRKLQSAIEPEIGRQAAAALQYEADHGSGRLTLDSFGQGYSNVLQAVQIRLERY